MKNFRIACLPGDGIGLEVMSAAQDVLQTAAEIHGGVVFDFTNFPWGSDYYVENGLMMPEDGIRQLKEFDTVFLGAVGNPKLVPDHISLWGMLIKIRRELELSLNVRPARVLRGIDSPLHSPNDFNFIVVRENSEGEYSEAGGVIHNGPDEIAVQNGIFTRKATERAIRYAFKLAKKRGSKVTSATKSNGIVHSMPFWDRIFNEVAAEYPDVETRSVHIDALSAFLVTKPETFDVIVASNLFGDILTDLGGAIMGSIGIAPSANLNPEGKYPSMFEPVHGSAPDIAGQGKANPLGQVWTASMMLDHLGLPELGAAILEACEEVTGEGIKTPDIGGTSSTEEVTAAICSALRKKADV
ncbi:tartrate dehydrogenase [Jeotgalibacillus proteolyticus]|uniref:D-malate dehydrogenase (decarboxylating) n=1 Tax=Jeotgalibacillus proteolyticus TaxID=2082395 RepID=A0A2S5GE72_9BACL|nr:tartrate dehydrogenase [Jeotgalibacillus proteolyticus]PPA71342.1 tartrate dehydrogenase [Jeotgalibacillus proteolyticus]